MATRKKAAPVAAPQAEAPAPEALVAPRKSEGQKAAALVYNAAYLAFIEMTTTVIGKVESDDLITAHAFARRATKAVYAAKKSHAVAAA